MSMTFLLRNIKLQFLLSRSLFFNFDHKYLVSVTASGPKVRDGICSQVLQSTPVGSSNFNLRV